MRTLWFFVTTNINQRSGSISYILWCSTWFRCKCVSDHGLAAAVDLDQLRCAIVTDHLFFSVRECACVWVTAIQTLPRLTVVMLVFVYYFMHLSIWCQHSVDQLSMVSSKRPHIWKKYVFSLPFPLSLSIYLSVDGMTRLVWMLNNNCKSFVCSSHSMEFQAVRIFCCSCRVVWNCTATIFALSYRLHLGKMLCDEER